MTTLKKRNKIKNGRNTSLYEIISQVQQSILEYFDGDKDEVSVD